MNNRGQLGVYEALIIIVLIACVGGIGYLYIHKPTQEEVYQKGSDPTISNITNRPLCGAIFDTMKEEKDDTDKITH